MHVYDSYNLGADRPPSASAYKRAVYKHAPAKFAVEVLSPQKHGNAFSYGLRICSLCAPRDRRSVTSSMSEASNASSSSSSSMQEYEIWRRWEDCLYFQELLEEKYTLMSREKRARLHAGKGVKKNGVYPREDSEHRLQRAASFDSLPPGPDPSMIAKDVHEYLPRLTKKGTLFRASQNTVDVRGHEFRALIEALFKADEETPTLILELRELSVVRDFFGFWRRDHDRIRKQDRDAESIRSRDSMMSVGSTASSNASTVRGSMFGAGAFGLYFSASNLSLQLPSTLTVPDSPTKGKKVRRPPQLASRLQPLSGSPMPSPVSPTYSEPGPVPSSSAPSGSHASRPRANTMQGLGAQEFQRPVASGSFSSRYRTTPLPSSSDIRQPVSAPPGGNFGRQAMAMAEMEDDFDSDPSDASSTVDSYTSSQTGYLGNGLPTTPRSAPPTFRSQAQMQESPSKGKGKMRMSDGSLHYDPQTLPLGVSGQFGEYADADGDSQYIIMDGQNNTLSSSFDLAPDPVELSRSASLRHHHLQQYTIEEEDEEEEEGGLTHDRQTPMLPSTARSSFSSSLSSVENAHLSTRSQSLYSNSSNSGAGAHGEMMFTDDIFGEDNMSVHRRDSDAASLSARMERARLPGAHAEALRVLTSRDDSRIRASSSSPVARALTPSNGSARTSGSSNSSGAATTTSSVGARSSVTSVESLSLSAATKSQSPDRDSLNCDPAYAIFEEALERRHWQRAPRDSMASLSSLSSFMSDRSLDGIIPPRPRLNLNSPGGSADLRRSLSAGSRRHGQVSRTVSGSGPIGRDGGLDDDELERAYLYQGFASPSLMSLNTSENNIDDDELRRSSSDFLESTSGSGRLSSSSSWSKERTPSATPRPVSPPLPSASSAGSFSSAFSSSAGDDSLRDSAAIAIKAIYHPRPQNQTQTQTPPVVVAFRTDRRGAAAARGLADVRAKLYDKLVRQQGVVGLAADFRLFLRVGGVRGPSEIEISSATAMDDEDASRLSEITSQEAWRAVVDGDGASLRARKLTLHIMD